MADRMIFRTVFSRMSSPIIESILGKKRLNEITSAGAIPAVDSPVVPIPAVKSSQSLKKRVKQLRPKRRSIVNKLLGEGSDDDQNDAEQDTIIPDGAKELKVGASAPEAISGLDMEVGDEVAQKVNEPDYGVQEPLMSPSVALVAPDATPKALEPVDVSEVPAPPKVVPPKPGELDALDVLLGKAKGTKTSSAASLPGIPTINQIASASVGITGEALLSQGSPMPEHRAGSGASVLEALRNIAS
jgi:hypothetical protein